MLIYLRVVVARVRNLMLPAPVLIGRMYRRPSISTGQEKIFDEKEGERSRHAPVSSRGQWYQWKFPEVFLGQLCKECSRLELSSLHTNMELSYTVAVMDKTCGWEIGKKTKIKLAHVVERVHGSKPKQPSRHGHRTWRFHVQITFDCRGNQQDLGFCSMGLMNGYRRVVWN